MKATCAVMALCAVFVLSGCAGMGDKWSGSKTGTNGSASASSMKSSSGAMDGAAGVGSMQGAESSIGDGFGSDVGNKALDRGTGDTR